MSELNETCSSIVGLGDAVFKNRRLTGKMSVYATANIINTKGCVIRARPQRSRFFCHPCCCISRGVGCLGLFFGLSVPRGEYELPLTVRRVPFGLYREPLGDVLFLPLGVHLVPLGVHLLPLFVRTVPRAETSALAAGCLKRQFWLSHFPPFNVFLQMAAPFPLPFAPLPPPALFPRD